MNDTAQTESAFRPTPARHPAPAAGGAAPRADIPRPDRIIIATVNRPQGDTGVHTHTRALQAGLAAAGVACAVATPFSGSFAWMPVFALRKLIGAMHSTWGLRWYRHWHGLALRQNLARVIGRGGARAVLAQCPVSAAAAMIVRAKLSLDFPIIMACHFNFSEATEYRERGELEDAKTFDAMLEFERQILTSVDHVVYVSGWARQVVENERHLLPRQSSVIWNGIADIPGIAPVSREQLGLAAQDQVLINVGTLEPRKNQLALVDRFADLAEEFPRSRLLLIGEGPDRPVIQRQIEKRQMNGKVRLLGLRRDVAALLPIADVYVHFAAMENCPVVLIEAARAGLPIAAAPGGGTGELLKALGGVSLENSDGGSPLHALRPLLLDPALRRRMGENARAAFVRCFTQPAMVSAYLNAMDMATACGSEALP